MKNTIHFVLQGKGGIGKSFISALLAQMFKQKKDLLFTGYDTDQENTTFAQYKALDVEHIPVMDDSRQINTKKFDVLIEKLLMTEGVSVVDNGANTFAPLLAYMLENNVIDLLNENGRKVYIHTIVGGGDTMSDSANGFNSIANGLNAPVVLWINEFFGEMKTIEGKSFFETKVFKAHEDKLVGLVILHKRNSTTFGDDIKKMTTRRLTVYEVMGSDEFSIMEKQRIGTFSRDVFSQIEKINWSKSSWT